MSGQLKISQLLQSGTKKRRGSDAHSYSMTAGSTQECLDLSLQYPSAGAMAVVSPEMIKKVVNMQTSRSIQHPVGCGHHGSAA
jgi:hypothetical protein